MWTFSRLDYPMWLHQEHLLVDSLDRVLEVWFGEIVGGLLYEGRPLYRYKNGKDLARIMPYFD